jgi:hypothetical protein
MSAPARQLLDGCSRAIKIQRLGPGQGVECFQLMEVSAWPEFPAPPGVVLPAASDEFPSPFYEDGNKVPLGFIGASDEKQCNGCLEPLLGDEITVYTLRQLMCSTRDDAGACAPISWATAPGQRPHYFPHVFHEACILQWFETRLNTGQSALCPACRNVPFNAAHGGDVPFNAAHGGDDEVFSAGTDADDVTTLNHVSSFST